MTEPVTVGDLVKPCPHERWEGHFFVDCPHKDGAHLTVNSFDLCNENNQKYCSSRPATVADLVSALRAEGVLVVEKVDGRWPIEVIAGMAGSFYGCRDRGILLTDTFIEMLDALAEAQR